MPRLPPRAELPRAPNVRLQAKPLPRIPPIRQKAKGRERRNGAYGVIEIDTYHHVKRYGKEPSGVGDWYFDAIGVDVRHGPVTYFMVRMGMDFEDAVDSICVQAVQLGLLRLDKVAIWGLHQSIEDYDVTLRKRDEA